MSGAIIQVENLGKRYRLGAGGSGERYTALRDVISEKAAVFFKKLKTDKMKSGNGLSDVSVSASQNFSILASQDSISEQQFGISGSQRFSRGKARGLLGS